MTGAKKSASKPKQADPAQSKRFIEAARAAGADETKEGAERAFDKVARSKSKATKSARR